MLSGTYHTDQVLKHHTKRVARDKRVRSETYLRRTRELHDETSRQLEVIYAFRDGILLRLCGRRSCCRLFGSRHVEDMACRSLKRGANDEDGGRSKLREALSRARVLSHAERTRS